MADIIHNLGFYFTEYGYSTVFFGSFFEMSPLGWFIPGGVIVAVAGFFANHNNQINLIPLIIYSGLGAWLTFVLSYLLGHKTGMWLVKKLKQEKNAAFAKTLLAKHGGTILTTSMMANLTRFWIAYVAGVEKYKFTKFLTYSGVASFGWSSLMALGGFIVGYQRQSIENVVGTIGIVGWIFLGIAGFAIHRSIKHEYKHFKEDVPHTTDEDSK